MTNRSLPIVYSIVYKRVLFRALSTLPHPSLTPLLLWPFSNHARHFYMFQSRRCAHTACVHGRRPNCHDCHRFTTTQAFGVSWRNCFGGRVRCQGWPKVFDRLTLRHATHCVTSTITIAKRLRTHSNRPRDHHFVLSARALSVVNHRFLSRVCERAPRVKCVRTFFGI